MMSYREFTVKDYDAACAVWTAAGREIVPLAELTYRPSLVLVADDGDSLAGVVMGTFDGRRGMILRLAVHPARRRQGIARGLVGELETRFRAIGCPRVNLLVMPDNDAGLRFWQELGYLPAPDVLCTKPLSPSQ